MVNLHDLQCKKNTLYLNAQIFIRLVKPTMNSVNNELLQKKVLKTQFLFQN